METRTVGLWTCLTLDDSETVYLRWDLNSCAGTQTQPNPWYLVSGTNEAQVLHTETETEVAQSCPTLRDPMDCSLPGSSVHGIFQARVLEWVAIAFSCLIAKRTQ